MYDMAWTNGSVIEFLDLYKNEQILWDPKHPLHRNRSEINAAWTRIQSCFSLNCSIQDLKKKKESLMTSFRMHWNKKKKTVGSYHTTWFAYPHMESFLSLKYECDSTSHMENEFFVNTTNNQPQQQISSDHNIAQRNSAVESNNVVGRYTRTLVPHANGANNKTSKTNSPSYGYAKNETNEDNQMRLPKSIGESRDFDEYDLYGQLLAKKLRKLKEHQRDLVMHEIDNIMFRAKIQSGTSQSRTARSYSSSPSPVPRKMKSPVFIVTQPNHEQYEDENISYDEHTQTQGHS